jgi:prepilin-type N-terminal cleavage/methylation domain-containing protein
MLLSAKMRSRPARRFARPAYSLIELLIVVAIMGILAGLVLPKFEPNVYEQLQGTAQIVGSDLAYARNLAVTNDSQYSLSFLAANNSYTLEHTGANSLLDVLPLTAYRHSGDAPNEQVTYLADLPRIGAAVEVVGIEVAGGGLAPTGAVEFNALGGLASAQPAKIWLGAGSGNARRYLSILVKPATGLFEVGEFQAAPP